MAKLNLSLRIHLSLFLLCLSFLSGRFLKRAIAQRTWCVANPTSDISVLVANLDYACSHIDCRAIQQGGSCFYPNTYIHHASFAMNMYYQTMGRHISDCNFRDSGLISTTDPSYESCTFQSGGDIAEGRPSASENSSAPEIWCVAKPGTSNEMLQQNINYACNHVDCSPALVGGSCYYPTTLLNHASFAMNLYFQSTERNSSGCDFRNTGLIVMNDPSYGNCSYTSRYYGA